MRACKKRKISKKMHNFISGNISENKQNLLNTFSNKLTKPKTKKLIKNY